MKKIVVIIPPVILLLFWLVISYLGLVNTLILPPPQIVLKTLFGMIISGSILPDAVATLLRALAGFCISACVGIPLGLLLGYFKGVYHCMEFLVDFLRTLPVVATIPVYLLFFGLGDKTRVAVVVLACTLMILVNSIYGVHNARKLRIMVAKTLRMSEIQLFTKIILPEALPHIFVGLRLAVSYSFILALTAEMITGTTTGLGQRILDAHMTYRIPEMYAVIILAGCIGYTLNKIFVGFERKIVHWTGY